jgi:EthD domain
MLKVIHLIKRQPHLTHQQFREHFEASHAAMALKYCGHLFVDYQRNYVDKVWGGGDARDPGSGYGEMDWGWDLMSEWTVADQAALDEIYRIMETPGFKEQFWADEDRFIDRKANVTIPCTVMGGGNAFDAADTVFDTPDGTPDWTAAERRLGKPTA